MPHYIPNDTPAVVFRIQLQSLASSVLCCVMCYRKPVEVTEVITESRCWGDTGAAARFFPLLAFVLAPRGFSKSWSVCVEQLPISGCPNNKGSQQQAGNLFRDEKKSMADCWGNAITISCTVSLPPSLAHSLSFFLSICLALRVPHTEHRTEIQS